MPQYTENPVEEFAEDLIAEKLEWPPEVFSMDCGRATQLAMEFRQMEMVEMLLAYGADIALTQPA